VAVTFRTKIPIVLLTGFLGSGKTTLLANWVRSPTFGTALAVINELGAVGLDHRLVAAASEAPVLLEGGCACCAAGDDLVATLETMFWNRLEQRGPKFTSVIVETTGMADPFPILDRLAAVELTRDRFEVAGVVTTFDAGTGPALAETHPEVRRQLEAATVVVLTKTDLAMADDIARAEALVARRAPRSAVLRSGRGSLSADALMAAVAGAPAPVPGAPDAVHTADVSAAFVPLAGTYGWEAAVAALTGLATAERALLRVKGVVRVAGAADLQIVQTTPGRGPTRADHVPFPGEAPPELGLTVIAGEGAAGRLARDLATRLDGPAPKVDVAALGLAR
jgi:G3E family GTPase